MRIITNPALATIAALSAGCQTLGSGDSGGGWTEVGCGESFVALVGVPGKYECKESPELQRPWGGGLFQRFGFSGSSDDGTEVTLEALKAMNFRSYIVASSIDATAIRNLADDVAGGGQDWSAPRQTSSGATVMDFTSNGRNCFGVTYGGGSGMNGYTYAVRGVFCRQAGRPPFNDDEERALLNDIVVRS
jgi:hypothetical protein